MFGDLFGGRRRPRRSQAPAAAAAAPTSRRRATICFTDAIERRHDLPAADLRRPLPGPATAPAASPAPSRTSAPSARAPASSSPRSAARSRSTRPARRAAAASWSTTSPARPATARGRGLSARTIQARIPAGVKDGQRIRLRGKGGAGENGGPAGDLYVTVKVTPHRLFGRKGDNLTLDVPVSFDEAALGADIKIPTLAGAPVTLKIPAGTPNGRTFRVRGKGAPEVRRHATATCWPPSRCRCPAASTPAAREAVEAYRAATAGKPLRANLFESS